MGPTERLAQVDLLLPFKRIESGDDVQPVVDQLRQLLPEVTEVLIDHRDRAMAQRLHSLRCEGHDVVAVIGLAITTASNVSSTSLRHRTVILILLSLYDHPLGRVPTSRSTDVALV